nr:hypothetical protein [Tanacetum cinerariifolium]
MDNMIAVFDAKVTIRGTLHTLTSIKELLGHISNERRRTRFSSTVFDPLKKVRVLELLELTRKPEMGSALSDEDSVKVCLLLKTKKIDSSKKIETYNVYGFVWSLKKDPLVIPRGLAWSKIGNFKKRDYGALFAEWSNHILSMAPTSTELLQPWLIRRDGDPSIVLKELVAVKQKMNAIERFIKSRNDNLSKDSMAKQSAEKEIESSNGKRPESLIPDVLNGQVSCEKYVGGFYDCESSKLYYTDPKEYPSSSMTQLLQAAEYAEFNFDNTENDSLSDMVKIGEEEIHLDGLEIVDDAFVQTPDKQNSELFWLKESTKLKKKWIKKELIKQSQKDLKEISLVEFYEDLSRAPYSQRTKVKLPECIDMVYALGAETSYIFP